MLFTMLIFNIYLFCVQNVTIYFFSNKNIAWQSIVVVKFYSHKSHVHDGTICEYGVIGCVTASRPKVLQQHALSCVTSAHPKVCYSSTL